MDDLDSATAEVQALAAAGWSLTTLVSWKVSSGGGWPTPEGNECDLDVLPPD